MLGKRILIDTSKCTACKSCQVACQQWHSLEAEDTTFTGSYTNPSDLSGANLTLIRFTEVEAGGKLKWLFFNDRCRHCETPTCRVACPLTPKAIKRQANGIVRIDPDLCHPELCSAEAIKPCQQACPFKSISDGVLGIPKKDYVKNGDPVTTVMRKCDFCYNRMNNSAEANKLKNPPFVDTDPDRVTNSALPACKVACPPGAIKVGAADAMLTQAKKRVKKLKNMGYPNANVYPAGLQTHVIWVLLEAPSTYGIVDA
jgi:Fe-S-cluster-containing dehydrogenase component